MSEAEKRLTAILLRNFGETPLPGGLITDLLAWGETQYIAGMKMQRKLIRLRLGLGTEEDSE